MLDPTKFRAIKVYDRDNAPKAKHLLNTWVLYSYSIRATIDQINAALSNPRMPCLRLAKLNSINPPGKLNEVFTVAEELKVGSIAELEYVG